jgi:hypothetical protein
LISGFFQFLDNASAHVLDYVNLFEDVKIICVPSRTTPVMQPMDQGVISALKSYDDIF